jgi:hypothetical protein
VIKVGKQTPTLIVAPETCGFCKRRAQRIELVRHNDGQVKAPLKVSPGDRAWRATVSPQNGETADSMGTLPLICLRVIAIAERGDVLDLAQPVFSSFVAEPIVGSGCRAELYIGPEHLQFDYPSDALHPVKEILSAKYAHLGTVLPYGTITGTYTGEVPVAGRS